VKTLLALPQGQRALALPTFGSVVELRTSRTLLRAWRDDDLPAWVAMNADPAVRRYFSSLQTETEALGEAGRIRANLARRGWGVWALEIPGKLPFAGFVGLNVPAFEAPFMPTVEMGWRLPVAAWGQGWASEAAAAAAAFGFEVLGLDELVAFTTVGNQPSRRVMARLGMQHDPADDFEHPTVPEGHAFRPHVMYRLSRSRFLRR